MRAFAANRSPWIEELPERAAAPPIENHLDVDVAIVGAGIAGVATAFFVLTDTDRSVLLLDADRVASGATGFNAGQLATYFERPLCRLAAELGLDHALGGQRELLDAWALLDRMHSEAGLRDPVHRFPGRMGMFTLDHVSVHLENNLLREQAGLPREEFWISETADFLPAVPRCYAHLFTVVPQRAIDAILETEATRYTAVLSETKGCINGARLCEEVVLHLARTHPGRFRLAEGAPVDRIVLAGDHAALACGPHRVRATRVVLCTNGFSAHSITDRAGMALNRGVAARVRGTIGFMAGFLEPLRPPAAVSYIASPRIGEGQAYYYVTRRPVRRGGRELTFTCVGGPDAGLADAQGGYDRTAAFPPEVLERLDDFIRPIVAPGRSEPLPWDYAWHGLMAYTDDHVRVVGSEPESPVLLYNLGCNGVGLLASIHGGHRIARLLRGERLEPSIFDPR